MPKAAGSALLIEGKLTPNGEELSSGDAAKVKELPQLTMHADEATELILIDVPMTFEAVGIWQGRLRCIPHLARSGGPLTAPLGSGIQRLRFRPQLKLRKQVRLP